MIKRIKNEKREGMIIIIPGIQNINQKKESTSHIRDASQCRGISICVLSLYSL